MTDPTFPDNVPLWVSLVLMLAGWISANIWPVAKEAISKKFGVQLDAWQARAALDVELARRQLDIEEQRMANEKALTDVMSRLSTLVEQNIQQTREMNNMLVAVSNNLTTLLANTPTARDIHIIVSEINELKAIVSRASEKTDR